jgi:hypothetical protein
MQSKYLTTFVEWKVCVLYFATPPPLRQRWKLKWKEQQLKKLKNSWWKSFQGINEHFRLSLSASFSCTIYFLCHLCHFSNEKEIKMMMAKKINKCQRNEIKNK